MFRKCVRMISGLIDRIYVLLFILMMLMGSYTIYDNWYVYSHASDRSILAYKPQVTEEGEVIDPGPISDEMVAWISIDDTDIDYPIMQAGDNAKYVNTDAYGNYSLTGAIFLDSRNSPDFTDEYSLIYGHHMSSGQMFGGLDKYKDKDYFESHKKATLIVNGKAFEMRLFAVCPADASEVVTFNPPLSEGLGDYIEEYAFHFDGTVPERYIGLSTCQTETTTSRLIVYGYVVDQAGLVNHAEKIAAQSPSFE